MNARSWRPRPTRSRRPFRPGSAFWSSTMTSYASSSSTPCSSSRVTAVRERGRFSPSRRGVRGEGQEKRPPHRRRPVPPAAPRRASLAMPPNRALREALGPRRPPHCRSNRSRARGALNSRRERAGNAAGRRRARARSLPRQPPARSLSFAPPRFTPKQSRPRARAPPPWSSCATANSTSTSCCRTSTCLVRFGVVSVLWILARSPSALSRPPPPSPHDKKPTIRFKKSTTQTWTASASSRRWAWSSTCPSS